VAYQAAIESIFAKGLSFWNSKPTVLRSEMELAIIRSDEALENFIRVRKTFMDPATKEMQDYAATTNSLTR